MRNLNLIFNKLYYSKLGASQRDLDESFENFNKQIVGTVFDNKRDYVTLPMAKEKFILKVMYPGLLVGTGNPHGSHKSDNDINMGFSFDYVSGQPFVPGSSVKGMLRSHFKERTQAVTELVSVLTQKDNVDVKALEEEIFDGKDIFFDAVVFDGDKYGYIMGYDTITPHADSVKNPVPISIIKVMPDVRFEFRFKLTDGLLTASEKECLFKELLMLFGIGAKTHTGYGVLENADDVILPKEKPSVEVVYKKNNNNYKNGNSYNKSYSQNKTNVNTDERITCPHCGRRPYKYNKGGKLNTNCFYCDKPIN